MPILNIRDHRNLNCKFKTVHAIIEPTAADNSVAGADQAERRSDFYFDERFGLSLNEALAWASSHPDDVTLFLYDCGPVTKPADNDGRGGWIDGQHRFAATLIKGRSA